MTLPRKAIQAGAKAITHTSFCGIEVVMSQNTPADTVLMVDHEKNEIVGVLHCRDRAMLSAYGGEE